MYRHSRSSLHAAIAPLAFAAFTVLASPAQAQETGAVRGTVTLTENGGAVHGAVVLVVGTGLVGLTAEDGAFEIGSVPPGSYEVLAQREHLTAGRQMITVPAGGTATVDFELGLSPVHEDVTVTASAGGAETTFEAFNAVTTLDSFDLVGEVHGSLGEALQKEPGIASRSFGPGSSRPVIRGFDGDRVLILEDGIRTGDLSSQSGDHGITIDPNRAERIEIVRGPATLLYGSNAVGGLVNVVTPHESYRESLFEGTRAQFTADAGSANGQAGTNASLQHAQNDLLFWAGGSLRRTGDYDTPEGTIENSATELTNARAGIGWFGDRFFASGGVTAEDGRYGVPFADEFHAHGHGAEDEHGAEDGDGEEEEVQIDLDSRRRVGRFDIGLRNLNNRVADQVRLSLNVIDWHHDELEIENGTESVGTRFDNRTYVVRADVEQQQTERLSGRFGAWTQVRDFEAVGAEALAPRTDLTSFAAFAYEELSFGRVRVQFGGRLERNDYRALERTGGQVHGEDDHDEEDRGDHGEDDHGEDDHGEDDHDEDDHDEDDHDEDDHDEDDHDEDDHDEDDHDEHGEEEDHDEHGEEDHDDHGEEGDHGEDDHDDHEGEDHDDHEGELVIEAPDPRDRDFVGASASIGLHADLGGSSAFVANLTRSHRAPALEELYNFGPHVGNLAFEVGNPDLDAETTLGLDLSLRHRTDRVRGNFSFFVYDIDNFIFGDRTSGVLDNLPVFNFVQGDSRFVGFDAQGSFRLAGQAWATLGLGYVDASLTATGAALPRIPPLRGTLSLDIPYGGFTVGPELMFAAKQDNVFRGETETDGYVVADVRASYVWPRQHTAHILTFTAYNLTNALYRNHTSFIKDLAPEMGRGFKVGYSVRFF